MNAFTWDQVNAWRLAQQSLSQRADRQQMLEVVIRMGAVHAQVMSAAELQLWTRVQGLTPSDVQDALWKDRTLVKTWLLRGTLHLLATTDLPLYIGVLSTLKHFRRASWQKYYGVSLDELEAIIEGVRVTLTDSGMTREQFASAIVDKTGNPKLRELLLSGWGVLLKPVAFQGYLCFGPSQGQNVTFVQPQHWIGEWQPLDSTQALKEFARRFLNTYGPATIDEFARWVGLEPSDAKRVFKSLADEIEEVEVEGWKAWMLTTGSLEKINAVDSHPTVRLLPNFDLYTLAVARHSQYVLPEQHKGRVYRPQGWISPVVLVDGRIEGVWKYEKKRSQIDVQVEMFAHPTSTVKEGIEAEAERLGEFLGGEVHLSISG